MHVLRDFVPDDSWRRNLICRVVALDGKHEGLQGCKELTFNRCICSSSSKKIIRVYTRFSFSSRLFQISVTKIEINIHRVVGSSFHNKI